MRNWLEFFNESLVIPGLKINDILKGLEKPGNNYKKILAAYFNTHEDYIDKDDVRTFKVNDLTGDILRNDRVMLKVMILERNELDSIVRDNVVDQCMSEFYSNLPNSLNIFGVELKPVSFINKDELEYTFKNILVIEELVNIVTRITGYTYNGEKDGYYIWSIKL